MPLNATGLMVSGASGLAPGAHGANRTGRPFSGDGAGGTGQGAEPAGPGELNAAPDGGYQAKLTENFSTGEQSMYQIHVTKVTPPPPQPGFSAVRDFPAGAMRPPVSRSATATCSAGSGPRRSASSSRTPPEAACSSSRSTSGSGAVHGRSRLGREPPQDPGPQLGAVAKDEVEDGDGQHQAAEEAENPSRNNPYALFGGLIGASIAGRVATLRSRHSSALRQEVGPCPARCLPSTAMRSRV